MNAPPTGPILVTGCSSGIGASTAQLLLEHGHVVYATARRPETLAALAAAGARTLALDVTGEESMQAAVAEVEREHGRVGTLINNAGYGVYGTVEEADLDAVRTMFETNVFGLARLTQLVLPGMRRERAGRIINISSMGGRIAFPVGGYYHATKFAVEGLSDALRNEVRQFGIDVVVVEPGPIRTSFEATINESAATNARDDSPYAALLAAVRRSNAQAYASRFVSLGPKRVARAVAKAVAAPRPRTRYLVSPAGRALVMAGRYGGDHVWDAIVRRTITDG